MSPGTFSMSSSEPSAASLGGGRGEPRPRAQQSGRDSRGQRLRHRPSIYRQGERTWEVDRHSFRQPGSADCSPSSALTAGVLVHLPSRKMVWGWKRRGGRKTGETVMEKPILRGIWLLL
uniref:Uncharacterized protein n=1 Tax=Mus spicilegus TaxID=10103 RepID=A0A8C6I7I3_MUSSI